MDPQQEYIMLINIFKDVRDTFETLTEDDMSQYKSLLERAQCLASIFEQADKEKFSILRDYLDFFNSKIDNQNRKNLSLVERGTNAGKQAERLGTAKGFVQRCPVCTFPSQRCKC